MNVVIVVGLALIFLVLVRRNLLQVDLSFPWFLALVVLGFASLNERFINWTAAGLGIEYEPIAIIFVTIFIVIGLSTFLAIAMSRTRARQIKIVRRLAQIELQAQEDKWRRSEGPGPAQGA